MVTIKSVQCRITSVSLDWIPRRLRRDIARRTNDVVIALPLKRDASGHPAAPDLSTMTYTKGNIHINFPFTPSPGPGTDGSTTVSQISIEYIFLSSRLGLPVNVH